MNFTLNISDSDLTQFESAMTAKLESLRQPVQSAMADALHGIVSANFGSHGFMRPWDWQELSPAYAKKVGRTFATLSVSGALKSTLRTDNSNPESSSVSMSKTGLVPYTFAHHYGNPENAGSTKSGSGEMPARRVFPLNANGQVMEEAVKTVTQAAADAVKGALQ